MREIRFRAWDKHKKEWYGQSNDNILTFNGFSLFGECMLVTPPRIDYLNNLEITQYTGLKDKNGVKIYEGDIMRIDDDVFKVEYQENSFCAVYDNVIHMEFEYLIYGEVIGNIYENPEFLNGEMK